MENRRKYGRNDESSSDYPMYSRLFIVCERRVQEQELRDAFSKYGTIEDIRIPRDHTTREPKGVVYIKFSKTSEAAAALEGLNSQVLPSSNRPLKVMVAANRSEIQSDDDHDEEKFKRLFINVPKIEKVVDIQQAFEQFGAIDSVQLQRDHNTGEPKGFAYVKFKKFSEAAKAIEECDRKYRAIFALPKKYNRRQETPFESNMHSLAMTTTNRTSLISMMNSKPEGYSRINFMCCPHLTQMHVHHLFDIVPGMVNCQYYVDRMHNCGKGTVSYSNPISAAYAVDKLDQFEYPPGLKIHVQPDNTKFSFHDKNFTHLPQVMNKLNRAITSATNTSNPDLAQLAEAIAEASKLVKTATESVNDDYIPDTNDFNYCSVKLPPIQPLADIDSPVAKRCFLVCKPQPPPLKVLRDVFCRFGDLINVYTLPSKMVGYARYATTQAADNAIKTLHGAEICNVRMKVLEADEEAPSKRMRSN